VSRSPSPQPLPHAEEQRALRSETIAAFHNATNEGDDDDLLVPREKTKDEMDREEEEYREFLAREVGEDLKNLVTIEEDVIGAREVDKIEIKEKKGKKSKDKGKEKATQETEQEFLMKYVYVEPICVLATELSPPFSYILNRGWIDHSTKHIPTYKEITGSTRSKGKLKEALSDEESPRVDDAVHDLDDDDFEEIAERFESSYNFRFEEPYAFVSHSLLSKLLTIYSFLEMRLS
jgi:protein KRI1